MQRKTIAIALVLACSLLAFYALYVTAFVSFSNRPRGAVPATRSPRPTATMRPLLAQTPAAGPRTVVATQTAQPTVTPSPTPIDSRSGPVASARGSSAAVLASALNNLALDRVIVISDAVRENMHSIFARGLAAGRNPRAFAKVGDSTMVWPPFLAAFDNAQSYKLGPYTYLQPTIAYLAGSYARESVAVQKGMHTWGEFDAALANKALCRPGEGPLACELRLHNPSMAIIRLGVNDAYVPGEFREQLRKIVATCIDGGVIPILGTKPDRIEGADNTINGIIYEVAEAYSIPLWDYDAIAATVPGKGLQDDNMHFVGGGSHDYAAAAAFQHADSMQDLTGLMVLDALLREVQPDQVR